jgi:DNA-directed RNA polymerase specialized sigma subunit
MSASVTRLPRCPPEGEEASDRALVRLVQSLPRGTESRDAACEELVARYQSLVRSLWRDLPERQQRLLMMRFYGNMTQTEIGERLGISQMHVSRLLAGALDYLRECIAGPDS